MVRVIVLVELLGKFVENRFYDDTCFLRFDGVWLLLIKLKIELQSRPTDKHFLKNVGYTEIYYALKISYA